MTLPTSSNNIVFRETVFPEDIGAVQALVTATKVFTPAEIGIAAELVDERLKRGESSGYYFVFATQNDRVIGYTCHGPIPCTQNRVDLYWIAVHPDQQNNGLGSMLLKRSERAIAATGATRIYVETSSQPRYEPTRMFYQRKGYCCVAQIKNFYADNDDKIIYEKVLGPDNE